MNVRNWLVTLLCFSALACTPNIVSSGGPDAGDLDAGACGPTNCNGCCSGTTCTSPGDSSSACGSGGEACNTCTGTDVCGNLSLADGGAKNACGQPRGDGGTDAGIVDAGAGPYPPPPYGVSVNRVIQNFTFPGYLSARSGVKINTLPKSNSLDLQAVRNLVDANGKRFRFLLLDISGGWCPPCNQEAQDLGLQGTKSSLTANWASRGGLFFTVLVEGYDESTHNPPVPADLETWANQHAVQSSLAIDPGQILLAQGINPSALPTNLVIDLRTMTIVAGWYALDTTYQKWEAALNGP